MVNIGRVQIREVGEVTVAGVVFGKEGDGKGIEGADVEFRDAGEEQIVGGGAGVLLGLDEVADGVEAENALVERRLDDTYIFDLSLATERGRRHDQVRTSFSSARSFARAMGITGRKRKGRGATELWVLVVVCDCWFRGLGVLESAPAVWVDAYGLVRWAVVNHTWWDW